MNRETEERETQEVARRPVAPDAIARKMAETESTAATMRGRVGNRGMQRQGAAKLREHTPSVPDVPE